VKSPYILYRFLDAVTLIGYLHPHGKSQRQNLTSVLAEIKKKWNSRTPGLVQTT